MFSLPVLVFFQACVSYPYGTDPYYGGVLTGYTSHAFVSKDRAVIFSLLLYYFLCYLSKQKQQMLSNGNENYPNSSHQFYRRMLQI